MIERALKYFAISDDSLLIQFETENNKVKIPFPSGISVREALEKYIDLNEFPKVSFLKELMELVDH